MSAMRRFLVDFDAMPPAAPPAPRAALPGAVRPLFGVEPEPEVELPAAEPEVDRIGEAVADAVAEALAEAGAAHAAAAAEAAARHAAEMADARERWAAEEGAALAAGFRSAVEALGGALGEAAAAALEPLLGDAARRRAVDGLRDAVADLLLADAGGAVAVSGPVDLLDALRAALEAAGVGTGDMGFAASESAEVVVTAGNSRIETRLAAWAEALGRGLAGTAEEEAA